MVKSSGEFEDRFINAAAPRWSPRPPQPAPPQGQIGHHRQQVCFVLGLDIPEQPRVTQQVFRDRHVQEPGDTVRDEAVWSMSMNATLRPACIASAAAAIATRVFPDSGSPKSRFTWPGVEDRLPVGAGQQHRRRGVGQAALEQGRDVGVQRRRLTAGCGVPVFPAYVPGNRGTLRPAVIPADPKPAFPTLEIRVQIGVGPV